MNNDLRIVFFGTPDFAVASLKALIDAGKNVVAVVTTPDKPAGRGHKLQPSPVKEFAVEQNLPVLQPTNLKSEDFVGELASYNANLQIVVAFRMLPEVVWNMPKHGTYNVHGSLLPDYRGAAPINWAIINGEKETGVTTFKLQHEIDTGNILDQAQTAIGPNDSMGDLYPRLMHLGADLLLKSIANIESGKIELKPQPTPKQNTHAPKIFKETCKIDLNKTAQEIHNFVRGMSPFPAAFLSVKLEDGNIENWKILETRTTELASDSSPSLHVNDNQLYLVCKDVLLEIKSVQTPGKKRLSSDDFLRGNRHDLSALTIT
ncbi:MAG: methionyl-tRNA formyltransferase [Salibacteraceae bacterium]|nr:methionyl-tRNA formyltransferase [Salibacteraceae bacterium]